MKDPQDWSGEAGQSTEYIPDDHIRLPVGIPKDGQRYRNVVIEELSGIDDHLISSKQASNNGAIATSLVLCRCIQEVEGLLERKQNPEKQFDRALARNMTQVDRDFILSRIYMLSGNNDVTMTNKCPRCGAVWEEFVRLSDLEVIEWSDDEPLEIPFELEIGSPETVDGELIYHKEGILRFPLGKDSELIAKLGNTAAMVDSTIAACTRKLGTLEVMDQERAKRLKSRDRQKIMLTIQQDLPGLRQWKTITCDCNRDFEIVCDLTSFFDERRRKTKA
jgi:hypothetical protein